MIEFPQSFLWGTATSAYQVEGSPLADGAGPSIWHRFSHTPGLVRDGATADVTCDHYRRYPEDAAIMRSLGTNAYRFSISWSRIMPRGRGAVNAGARLLRPARRRAARPRRRAHGDALPLGSSRRARRPGRLAQSRHREVVRRVRGRGDPKARRPREA